MVWPNWIIHHKQSEDTSQLHQINTMGNSVNPIHALTARGGPSKAVWCISRQSSRKLVLPSALLYGFCSRKKKLLQAFSALWPLWLGNIPGTQPEPRKKIFKKYFKQDRYIWLPRTDCILNPRLHPYNHSCCILVNVHKKNQKIWVHLQFKDVLYSKE